MGRTVRMVLLPPPTPRPRPPRRTPPAPGQRRCSHAAPQTASISQRLPPLPNATAFLSWAHGVAAWDSACTNPGLVGHRPPHDHRARMRPPLTVTHAAKNTDVATANGPQGTRTSVGKASAVASGPFFAFSPPFFQHTATCRLATELRVTAAHIHPV